MKQSEKKCLEQAVKIITKTNPEKCKSFHPYCFGCLIHISIATIKEILATVDWEKRYVAQRDRFLK